MNPYGIATFLPDPTALAAYNAGIRRAREAYWAEQHPTRRVVARAEYKRKWQAAYRRRQKAEAR